MLPTLNMSELIGHMYIFGNPLFQAFFPWIGIIIGIVVTGYMLGGLTDFIMGKLEWDEEKDYLKGEFSSFREMFGYKEGGERFLRWGEWENLSRTQRDFLMRYEKVFGKSPTYEGIDNPNRVFIEGTGWTQGNIFGNIEQLTQGSEGWKSNIRGDFDRAMMNKDRATVKRLLPEVPKQYKERFAKEISKAIGKDNDEDFPTSLKMS